MEFSPIEQELVMFKALTETLDSMLNHEVMTIRGDDPNTEIVFATSTHMRLFNILLVDFLGRQNKIVVGSDASYLVLLEKVCQAPSIGDQNSIGDLAQATQCLHSWLNAEIEVCVWLPSIDNEVDLAIRRHDFIYICGNISKHNFARLTAVSKKLIKIFENNKIEISEAESFAILDEFYDRFHGDIFNYHASAIAEMLNRVRWCIHSYLEPLYHETYVADPVDEQRYEFRYPDEVRHNFARCCFWNLMNEVRRRPYIRSFQAPWYLQMRY